MRVTLLCCILAWLPSAAAFTLTTTRCEASTTTKLAMAAPVESPESRRGFMSSVLGIGVAASVVLGEQDMAVAAVAEPKPLDYKMVARDINKLIKRGWTNKKGPTLVRLAWHSSGTYDKMSKTGGSKGGTIRFKEELEHGANAGLKETAVKWLEPIHRKYAKQGLSYADLYTLAGGES